MNVVSTYIKTGDAIMVDKPGKAHIVIKNCSLMQNGSVIIKDMSWIMREHENWLITGSNGCGKSILAQALSAAALDGYLGSSNAAVLEPLEGGIYANICKDSVQYVSFETAAALIAQERAADNSEFIEGGIDIGKTVRTFILAALPAQDAQKYAGADKLEGHPAIVSTGIAPVLDRGLKYLSTGEIRKTLLARAIAAKPDLIILDEPFEGLDTAARSALQTFIETTGQRILLLMDSLDALPKSITHVLELERAGVSFCGEQGDYAKIYEERQQKARSEQHKHQAELKTALEKAQEAGILQLPSTIRLPDAAGGILVDMRDVQVQWGEKCVLSGFTWQVVSGEHWLIKGANGSGKTTLMELITGDNPQVFRNDIRLFGRRRGTGETIWELKEKMGIVTYRLHVDYRNFGDIPLETVVLSGMHDSIGLYQQCGEVERMLARSWLTLCGFKNREAQLFGRLSYGEQRAVLIARAAVKCPPLLILDEPCHGLDAESRRTVLTVLQSIAESGTSTILHVTHDQHEILPCEQHILELLPDKKPMYRITRRAP